MITIQKQYGPFAHPAPAGYITNLTHLMTHSAEDRLAMVRASDDREWLQAVIKDRDAQTAVRLAAERRLRKLTAKAKGPL